VNILPEEFEEPDKPRPKPNARQRSKKVGEPGAYFSHWAYAIDRHYWDVFGLSLRTFMKDKQPYQAWAIDLPETAYVNDGYIFYSAKNPGEYIQIAATYSRGDSLTETPTDLIEAHYSRLIDGIRVRTAFEITPDELRQWLETGVTPKSRRVIDRANSKAITLAWSLTE